MSTEGVGGLDDPFREEVEESPSSSAPPSIDEIEASKESGWMILHFFVPLRARIEPNDNVYLELREEAKKQLAGKTDLEVVKALIKIARQKQESDKLSCRVG